MLKTALPAYFESGFSEKHLPIALTDLVQSTLFDNTSVWWFLISLKMCKHTHLTPSHSPYMQSKWSLTTYRFIWKRKFPKIVKLFLEN